MRSLIKFCISSLIISILFSYKQVKAQKYPVSFTCINHQNTVKTLVDTNRGKIELITWKNNYYSSQTRLKLECQKASEILQKKYDQGDGKFLYIISDVWNWSQGDNGLICIFDGITLLRRNLKGKLICNNNDILISLSNRKHDNGISVMKDFFEQFYKIEFMLDRPHRTLVRYDLIKYLELAPIIDENIEIPSQKN